MANAYTASTDMSTIPQYYDKVFLERLIPQIIMKGLLMNKPLPKHSGTTMYFPRMSSSSTTVSAYKSAEGTIVSTEKVNDLRISATIETYRNAKAVWGVADLTKLSTYTSEVVEEQADQAAQIIDKRILESAYGTSAIPTSLGFSAFAFNTVGLADLGTSTSAFFNYVAATEYTMTAQTIRAAVKKLRARNVKPGDDGLFTLVVHSDTEMAIQADSVWQSTYQYTDPENMKKGLFGKYGGVKMARDNNIYTSARGSGGATLYHSILLGRGAMAVSELDGGVKTIMKDSGPQDTFNPVNEFITFGWKIHFVPTILNVSSGLMIITADA